MKHNNAIYHIAQTGTLVSLGLILGFFAHFPLFGSNVYLVGIVVFLMPLVLPISYSLIGGILIVILADVFAGWGANSWISALAYGSGIIILWFFSKFKFKIFYILGLLLASIATTAIYFFLSWMQWDLTIALQDLAATAIQFLIVIPVVYLLYWPIKLVMSKTYFKKPI